MKNRVKRILIHRKVIFISYSILNIYLRGRVGENLEKKIDSKLSNTQPRRKKSVAYKKKRVDWLDRK